MYRSIKTISNKMNDILLLMILVQILYNIYNLILMSHKVIATEAILFCSGYGVLSILQTLNSRYLYKNL